jgi:hypothetical protein
MPPVSELLFHFDPWDKRFQVVFLEIFLFQFQWVSTLLLLAGLGSLLPYLRRLRRRTAMPEASRAILFLSLVFLCALYVLTRAIPYNNLRYFLSLSVLLIPLSFAAMRRLFPSPDILSGVMAGLAALSFVSLYRSGDPVSAALLGTMPFGQHALYRVKEAAFDGCCGFGRDQLVYNLEHVKFVELQEKALRMLNPTPDTIVVFDPPALFFLPESLDPKTHRLARLGAGIRPHYMVVDEVLALDPPPQYVYMIEYPYTDNSIMREKLLWKYAITDTEPVEIDGYTMPVSMAQLKPTPPDARSTTPPS